MKTITTYGTLRHPSQSERPALKKLSPQQERRLWKKTMKELKSFMRTGNFPKGWRKK